MYRPDIDGLRALAIVAVIIHHLAPELIPLGHLGVDVFFVISGYVITSALSRKSSSGVGEFLLNFYAGRIKRLSPALLACIVPTAVVVCLVDPAPRKAMETAISALLGLSNLYLLTKSTDYFAPPAQLNAFTQTWSLGVEEQFYLVFPLLLWAAWLGRGASNGVRTLQLAITTLSLASLAGFLVASAVDVNLAFYSMPARFWELGAGSFTFLSAGRLEAGLKTTRGLATTALATLVVLLLSPMSLGAPANVVVVLLTTAILFASREGTTGNSLLVASPLVYVGRISYSLYLWHWAVIVLGRWTIGLGPSTFVPLLLAIATLAVASYHLVERPLRSAKWARSDGATIIVGIVLLVSFGMFLAYPADGRWYSGQKQSLIATGTGSLTREYRITGVPSVWVGASCVIAGDAEIGKMIDPASCTLGDVRTARRRLLVLGDSFSAAFVPGFDDLVTSHGYAVTIASSWGASAAPGVPNTGAWSRSNAYYWNSVAKDLASVLNPGDAIMLVSDLAGYAPARGSASSDKELSSLAHALGEYSERLSRRGIRLLILDATPPAREAGCEPSAAAPQWFRPGIPCSFATRSEVLSRRRPLDTMLAGLQIRKKITVVDLMDVFCPLDRCSYLARNGQLLYRDAHSHPSVEAAMASRSRIQNALLGSPRGSDSSRAYPAPGKAPAN